MIESVLHILHRQTLTRVSNSNPRLVDTFELFKAYLDAQISTLHKDLAAGNDSFA